VTRPIAHRGLHDREKGIVENTASAFAGAIAAGYAIECDLQLTSDGEAVVFHDSRLERLMEAEGSVRAFTAAQIKAMRLRGTSDEVQTLAELLTQVQGKVPLVIEFKSHWDSDQTLVKRALGVLQDYGGAYALMSFDPRMIEAVGRYSPATCRGIVADRADDDSYAGLSLARRLELRTLSHLAQCRPHFISFYFRDLPFAPITEFRQQGHPVISWTIRSPAEAADARRFSDQITFEGFRP
jgi:glycerophosphoryl diester phosphodiesterase